MHIFIWTVVVLRVLRNVLGEFCVKVTAVALIAHTSKVQQYRFRASVCMSLLVDSKRIEGNGMKFGTDDDYEVL